MTTKKKPVGEGNPQTGYVNSCASNDKPIPRLIKALIARAAIWGLLPIRTADCLIRRVSGDRRAY